MSSFVEKIDFTWLKDVRRSLKSNQKKSEMHVMCF